MATAECGTTGALDQVQGFARAPTAAISMTLLVSRMELADVLALEMVTPIF